MKRFGIRIITFIIPLFLFLILTFVVYHFSKIKVDSELRQLSQYECLLMGDSQIQRLNGDLITENGKNIASSGEHYYFTYNKLLNIFKNKNHTINTVVLGVSIHNFAPVYNRLFDINFPEGKKSLKRYLYFIQLFDNDDFIAHFKDLLQSEFILGVYSKPDWGGFKSSTNKNPGNEIINKTFDMHYAIKKNEDKLCYSQRTYLYKIDSLCSVHHVNLVLLSLPHHEKYKEKVSTEYYDFFSETLQKLKHRYHINFLMDYVNPNFMSDASHLNKTGVIYYADIIRKKLNARKNDTLLSVKNKKVDVKDNN